MEVEIVKEISTKYREGDPCPKCGGEVWMVEYNLIDPWHYDGTSEHACKNSLMMSLDGIKCDWRIGRWCGKELHEGEQEPRDCDGKKAHPKRDL